MNIKYFDLRKFGNGESQMKVKIKNKKTRTRKEAIKFYFEWMEFKCSCHYDCCGCKFSALNHIQRVGKNHYVYTLNYYRNI